MAEDPGGLMNGKDAVHGVSFYLDLIEYAPSEHAKTVIINEKLVPWTKSKGSGPIPLVSSSRRWANLPLIGID